MSLTKEVMEALQAPFPAGEIKLKIQAKTKNDPGKAIIVAYIDARNVMERLDEVAVKYGVEWVDVYREVTLGGKDGIECTLVLDGTARVDVGDPESDGMDNSLKSAYSDAFKRAAVKFGIGRFLYSLPKMYAKVDGNFIDKDELPRLQGILEKHLGGKVSVDEEDTVKEVKERVFSINVLEEVLKAGAADNHEDANAILQASVLPESVSEKTVAVWIKKYVASGGNTILECAMVANEAYIKASKKESK